MESRNNMENPANGERPSPIDANLESSGQNHDAPPNQDLDPSSLTVPAEYASSPDHEPIRNGPPNQTNSQPKAEQKTQTPNNTLTHLYTIAHLIFFSLFGTLARVGLTALTDYPGAPIAFGVLWSNVGGSFVMGFLIEDCALFRRPAIAGTSGVVGDGSSNRKNKDLESADSSPSKATRRGADGNDTAAAKKAHLTYKKTLPLYIGLATGFCGSFTSFSSFIRDMFLAVSNSLALPGQASPAPRSGGDSFMAMLAVLISTVALSHSALIVGGHLAAALEHWRRPSALSSCLGALSPVQLDCRSVLDPLITVLGAGCWLGAVFLAIFPPHDAWRGQVVFSLVFAPLGCLLRFYLALHLNSRFTSFPVGTFVANVLGTAVLGMAWDLAHAPEGGRVACQVLQGIEDGFCGCLTTISTWVAELSSLRRRSAWVYGSLSVVVSFLLLIAIMGGLRWTEGFQTIRCDV
jgi:CrcB protein